MLRLLTSTTVALLLTAVAFAQSTVTGKWEGQTPNGFKIVLDLKATESTVTGTLTREDTTVPIAEGKVTKNTVTFKATLERPDRVVHRRSRGRSADRVAGPSRPRTRGDPDARQEQVGRSGERLRRPD